jgi:hypothetical protein
MVQYDVITVEISLLIYFRYVFKTFYFDTTSLGKWRLFDSIKAHTSSVSNSADTTAIELPTIIPSSKVTPLEMTVVVPGEEVRPHAPEAWA